MKKELMRQEEGSMLVQVMVVAAVLAGAGLTVAQLAIMNQQSQRKAELGQVMLETADQLRLTLGVSAGCQPNLSHLNLNTFSFAPVDLSTISLSFSQIQAPPPNALKVIESGKDVVTGLKIESIVLQNFSEVSVGTQYTAQLVVTAKREILGASVASPLVTLPLLLTTAPVGASTTATITNCQIDSSVSSGAVQVVEATAADQPGGYATASLTTGTQACASRGKSCVHVLSFNYVDEAVELWNHEGRRCAVNYLHAGDGDFPVPSPVLYPGPHGPIHSCATKIGEFVTDRFPIPFFGMTGTCGAHFVAVCK